jgi:hypothetical protein
MDTPTWVRKITKKMIIIWTVCFCAFLVIAVGTVALIFGNLPLRYGKDIDYNKIFSIEYLNSNQRKQLFDKDSVIHDKPMRDIVKYLKQGGQTNKLTNFFTVAQAETVENNNTSTVYTTTFLNTYSKNALIISFSSPQYSVISVEDSATEFKLVTTDTAGAVNPVHAIYIPLDRTEDKLQAQSWFLLTYNPNSFAANQSLTISKRYATYGNYHKLGEYVENLYVRF